MGALPSAPMSSDKTRMLAGDWYQPADAQLTAERARARALCAQLNGAPAAERAALLQQLFGHCGAGVAVTPSFHCDYGYNISLAEQVYFNAHCVLLDVCAITVGAHTLFGPGVHIYTVNHPLDAARRRTGVEIGRPVHIGQDVWVGGATVICPGVTVGDGTVIGAGSVVTRSLPPGVLAMGNPCRVVRSLADGDRPGDGPAALCGPG